MINHLLLIFAVIIIFEFMSILRIISILKINYKLSKKILKLLTSKKIPDVRKEKLIPRYSKTLFINSVKIFVIIFIILLLMYILYFFSNSFINFITSILGFLELIIGFLTYSLIRKKIYG